MVKYTMGCESLSSIEITEKLMEMGFEKDAITVALEVAGPSFEDVIVYLSDKSCSSGDLASRALRKGTLVSSQSSHQTRQSSILEHFQAKSVYKQKRNDVEPVESSSDLNELPGPTKMEYCEKPHFNTNDTPKSGSGSYPGDWQQELCHEFDWETKASYMLQIHFGYSSLKKFQKEALSAWVVHQDCLVLAATGSGKSLCFQIPTLLTGKVVVVISPLISLMHDQCLKLAKHGISACFLGSGQPDSSVEKKAMGGMYSIIYVCPETVLRLIQPLQRLAETRGIALFAIDEVHCVSKWGHDFRPDYRRLSVLRENFSCCNLKFLKFDIPLMALTATATNHVREDILKSLCMSKETKIVLTSFFRSNLRFSVKHSRTSSPSSYEKDFGELIHFYTRKRQSSDKTQTKISRAFNVASDVSTINSEYGTCGNSSNNLKDIEDCCSNDDDNDDDVDEEVGLTTSKRREMTVEYLENEVDVFQGVDDWDVSCGEFFGQASRDHWDVSMPLETTEPQEKLEERSKVCHGPLEHGPTIIYVPTRKETLSIAKYLSQFGVKAAAYNASLPKSHLRKVHEKFHENTLEVVVATIAFGMGIDKLNVRRIIHYGWPQSLEAYYQEAGRAGRDGKLADCILFANLARIPSLLPSRRSEEQLNRARKMLADCFRYGMNTSCCRAKELVEYFGESFKYDRCLMCDVCVKGPPQLKDCKEEVDLLMQVIAAYNSNSLDYSFDDFAHEDPRQRSLEKLTLKVFVSKIREQSTKFVSTDLLWWKGLTRILEGRGYLKEGDKKSHVQLKFPACTKLGLECLSKMEETFFVYPQADMLLSTQNRKSYSSFSEWGSGWADLEIRQQRLKMMKQFTGVPREPKRRKGRRIRRHKPDLTTARGRITARLSKNM